MRNYEKKVIMFSSKDSLFFSRLSFRFVTLVYDTHIYFLGLYTCVKSIGWSNEPSVGKYNHSQDTIETPTPVSIHAVHTKPTKKIGSDFHSQNIHP